MKLSILVPVYNEEKLLAEFVKEITLYLQKNRCDYEFLLIENGSTDSTSDIANKIIKKNKKIKVFHLSQASYGRALIYGLKKAKGDFVVIFNVDFWDKNFLELIKVNLLGYDIVTGSKNLPGARDSRPLGRRLVTKSFNLLLRKFMGFKGTDTHGIKALRRLSVLPVIRKCKTQTGIFDSELIIRAQRIKMKILELPVEIIEKRPNRFGLKRILQTPMDIFKLYIVLSKD